MTQPGPHHDTTMGGEHREFPSTIWSAFLGQGLGDPAGSERLLSDLARHYWKPVYSYIRAKWSKTNEDAKDRTQDFFVWVMESGFLGRVDPARGRFRAFLKVALDHYLSDLERMQRSLKRGGDRKFLSIEGGDDDLPVLDIADGEVLDPAEILDEVWRREVFARAVERLEKVLEAEGKGTYFQVFRDYFLGEEEKLQYEDVAARYGLQASDVSNYLMHAKRRFRAVIAELVSETVTDRRELEAELKWLFQEEGA